MSRLKAFYRPGLAITIRWTLREWGLGFIIAPNRKLVVREGRFHILDVFFGPVQVRVRVGERL